MQNRGHLPTDFFADDTYTIAPQRPAKETTTTDDRWLPHEPEGQLAVDVFESDDTIIITAPIAGVKPQDLEVYVSNDLITIRGRREDCSTHQNRNYLFQECHWGSFSRSIILPTHISSDNAEATLKGGVLTVTLPKLARDQFIPIEVFDEDLS